MSLRAEEMLALSPSQANDAILEDLEVEVPEFGADQDLVDVVTDNESGQRAALDAIHASYGHDSLPVVLPDDAMPPEIAQAWNDEEAPVEDAMPPEIAQAWNEVMREPDTAAEDAMPPEILRAWNEVMDADQVTWQPVETPQVFDPWMSRVPVMVQDSLPLFRGCQGCTAPAEPVRRQRKFSTVKFLLENCDAMKTWKAGSGPFVTLKHAHSKLILDALKHLLLWMGYTNASGAHEVFKRLKEPAGVVSPLKWSTPRSVSMNSLLLRYLQPELTQALFESDIRNAAELAMYWKRGRGVPATRWPHTVYLIVYMVFLADERRQGETAGRASSNAKRRSKDLLIHCMHAAPPPVKTRRKQRWILSTSHQDKEEATLDTVYQPSSAHGLKRQL